MICTIYCKSKKISPNIWSRIKSFNNNNTTTSTTTEEFKEYTLDDLITSEITSEIASEITSEKLEETSKGQGFFVKINNEPYVITCNHVIGLKNLNICAFANNKENVCERIDLILIKRIPELDIVILKFENDDQTNNFDFYIQDELNTKINEIERFIKTSDSNHLILKILMFSNITENIIPTIDILTSDVLIESEDFIGHMVPKIPLITFLQNGNILNDSDLPGYSGSILMYRNIPLGMLSRFDTKTFRFQTIPMCLINIIITNALSNPRKVLSGFNIPMKTVGVELDNPINNKVLFIGKSVLPYKNVHYKKLSNNKNFYFYSDDVILKIDNCEFNGKGTIFSDDIGYNINVDMFMMMKCYMSVTNSCKFLIARNKKTEKHINVELIGYSINLMYNIKIFNDHKYISWRGFTFAEISEEIINEISNTYQYDIEGSYIKMPKKSDGSKKHVIVVDINEKLISDKYLDMFYIDGSKTQIPLVDTDIGKQLVILDKIGNKFISRIEDIKIAITNKNNKNISLFYEK